MAQIDDPGTLVPALFISVWSMLVRSDSDCVDAAGFYVSIAKYCEADALADNSVSSSLPFSPDSPSSADTLLRNLAESVPPRKVRRLVARLLQILHSPDSMLAAITDHNDDSLPKQSASYLSIMAADLSNLAQLMAMSDVVKLWLCARRAVTVFLARSSDEDVEFQPIDVRNIDFEQSDVSKDSKGSTFQNQKLHIEDETDPWPMIPGISDVNSLGMSVCSLNSKSSGDSHTENKGAECIPPDIGLAEQYIFGSDDSDNNSKFLRLMELAKCNMQLGFIPRGFEALNEAFVTTRRALVGEFIDAKVLYSRFPVQHLVLYLVAKRTMYPFCRDLAPPLRGSISQLLEYVASELPTGKIDRLGSADLILARIDHELRTLSPSNLLTQVIELQNVYPLISGCPRSLMQTHFAMAKVLLHCGNFSASCKHITIAEMHLSRLTHKEVHSMYADQDHKENDSQGGKWEVFSSNARDWVWQILHFKYFEMNKCLEALCDLLNMESKARESYSDSSISSSESLYYQSAQKLGNDLYYTRSLILVDVYLQLGDLLTATLLMKRLSLYHGVDSYTSIPGPLLETKFKLEIRLAMAQGNLASALTIAEDCVDRCNSDEFTINAFRYRVMCVRILAAQNRCEAGDVLKELSDFAKQEKMPNQVLELHNIGSQMGILQQDISMETVKSSPLRLKSEYEKTYDLDCLRVPNSNDLIVLFKRYFPGTMRLSETNQSIKDLGPFDLGAHSLTGTALNTTADIFKYHFTRLYEDSKRLRPPVYTVQQSNRILRPRASKNKRQRDSTGSPRRVVSKHRCVE